MKKQSQLADLIAGSGLVSGVGRRASSQDGVSVPSQPVLYHFGARSGSARDQRDRPPLPNGFSNSGSPANPPAHSAGGGRSPPVAWSSAQNNPIAGASSLLGDAALSLPSSSSASSGPLTYRSGETSDPIITTITASVCPHPLPQLGNLRTSNAVADGHIFPTSQGFGFLPTVSGPCDVGQGQAPLDSQVAHVSSPSPSQLHGSTTGASAAMGAASGSGEGAGSSAPDTRSASIGGANGSSSIGGCGGGWTFYGGPALLAGSPLPSGEYCSDGRPPAPGSSIGGSSFGGAVEMMGASGAWQAHMSAGGADGSSINGGGVGTKSMSTGGGVAPANGRNVHSGGRTRAYGGGGGGFNSKQRWVRPSSTSRVDAVHRASSENSMRAAADAAGVTLAISVQGPWTPTGLDSNCGTIGGSSSGCVRSSRAGPLSSGGPAELVVVEEESSSAFELSKGTEAAGGSTRGGAAATQVANFSVAGATGAAATRLSTATVPYSAAAAGNSALPSPYMGPAGAAAAAAATAVGAAAVVEGPVGSPTSATMGTPHGTSSDVFTPLIGISNATELVELRRMILDLNAQVARLTAQLRDSELSAAQLQFMATEAVASEREAAEMEAGRRHMKALRAAEAARDKAEAGRRGAEKRARTAEEELAATRDKLESKMKQVADLEAAVAATQAALEKQRKAHEEALEVVEGQHKAQARKQHQDMDVEKKSLLENVAKVQSDLAKRNQMVLALQADLEDSQAAVAARDKQLEEVRKTLAQLEMERERERGRWLAEEEARAEEERQQQQREAEEASLASPGRAKISVTDTGEATAAAATETAPTSTSTANSPPQSQPQQQPQPQQPVAVRRASFLLPGGGIATPGGGGSLVMDEQSRAIRKMQTEVAAIREEYAKRLVEMDEVVAAAEANMRDGVQGLERMFHVLVSRTAALLAGRMGGFKGGLSGGKGLARPGTPIGRPGTASAVTSVATGANPAVIHMNERLAMENAQLLAELARWQSGRHAMLRKLNMAVLGTDPAPPPPPPLTHQQKIAQALAAVTGQAPAAAIQPPPATAAAAAAAASGPSRFFQYQKNFTGTPPPASAAAAAAADTAMTAAREALAVATRDALLAGRKELLPAVMTAEGWGGSVAQGGGWDTTATTQQMHGGKVEASLAAAESSMRLRTQLLALQTEVAKSRATGGEVVEKGREREALEEDYAMAMADLRRELAAAKHQISHLLRELERARAGITAVAETGRANALDVVERERLEEALSAVREDGSRYKQVAAAAKRELEAKERALEEAQLKGERLEAQCREARSESQKQVESVKRLRLLLAQARALLREHGVPFMEDDPGLDLLLQAEKDKDKGGGLKGRNSLRHGASGNMETDGSLFKALDAREREKEVARLQADSADLAAQLAAANKELKKVRKTATAAAEAAELRERDQRMQLAGTIDSLARDAEVAKEANRGMQRQLQDAQHEAGELRRQISDLTDKLTRAKLDTDYLRARATAGRMKPKLSHARALSISISPAAAAQQTVAAEG